MNTTDHFGNTYSSIAEKCRAYNISTTAYRDRIQSGWDEKSALTVPVRSGRKHCFDHLGTEYPSLKEMCLAYDVSPSTFLHRVRAGQTVENALLGRPPLRYPLDERYRTDDDGTVYPTEADLCRKRGLRLTTYKNARLDGKSPEEAAELARNPYETKDHKGNTYKSIREMCLAYRIMPSVFRDRRRKGLSLEECLSPVERAERSKNGKKKSSKRIEKLKKRRSGQYEK